ncbi:hypothetical protein GCM10022419_105360 [Nonomuraea rosea]|uniref:Knr4/Smi1-like domain-containing protein n=1 Tax=Nonomuraea rosea TaxID=638574 RepID=A0ABP6ZBA1_9ACTN
MGQQQEPESGQEPPIPEPAGFAVRTPDPALTARVGAAWDRVERWLGAHASATLRKLCLGAEPERLAQWEHYAGSRLPDDLYASYLRYDGADGNLGDGFRLPGGYGLLGVNEIDYITTGNCQNLVMAGDLADADPEHGTWHGTLLPTGSDASGHELFVEPSIGRVGEAAFGEQLRYDGPMGFTSHAAMLEPLAAALEGGAGMGGSYPTVTGSCELRWAAKPAPLPGGCAGGPRPTPRACARLPRRSRSRGRRPPWAPASPTTCGPPCCATTGRATGASPSRRSTPPCRYAACSATGSSPATSPSTTRS